MRVLFFIFFKIPYNLCYFVGFIVYHILLLFFNFLILLKVPLKKLQNKSYLWLCKEARFWRCQLWCFYIHFLEEFFPFVIQTLLFINKRFWAWYRWNFEEHWTFFRLIIFLITLLSLIKPIYFLCRWTGYLYYFLCNVIFMLWRAFFTEIFIYFFRFIITPYNPYYCLQLRFVLLYLYREYSNFGNQFSMIIARGFGLCYIDFFVSYLDSLRYRDWDKWILQKSDQIIYFIDEVFDFFKDLYSYYDWYKGIYDYWFPIYVQKIKSFFKRIWRFLKWFYYKLKWWFSLNNYKLIKHKIKFYFFSKYGRRVIRTQIKAYYTVLWAMYRVTKLRLKVYKMHYSFRIKFNIKYVYKEQFYYCWLAIALITLTLLKMLSDFFSWIIFDTVLWELLFVHIFTYILYVNEMIFYRFKNKLIHNKRKLLYYLHDKPFFRRFLKHRYEPDETLFNKRIDEYAQIAFDYQRKFPYVKVTYDINKKMVVEKITIQSEIDKLVSIDVRKISDNWRSEGEIPSNHLAWLSEMRIYLQNARMTEEFLVFKTNCEAIKKFISDKKSSKIKADTESAKKILSLEEYFEKKKR